MSSGLPLPSSRLIAILGAVLIAAIVVASLVPAGWQVRLGLHWLAEHFLAYFSVTSIFCLAWRRPMVVAAVLIPFAVLLEALQGLTPDRVPDLATTLSAATGVAVAALLAELAITLRKRAQISAAAGRKA